MISIEDHLSALISKERCLPTDLSDTVQFNLLIFILEKKDLYQLPTNIKKFHFLVNCLWIPNDCKLKPDFHIYVTFKHLSFKNFIYKIRIQNNEC